MPSLVGVTTSEESSCEGDGDNARDDETSGYSSNDQDANPPEPLSPISSNLLRELNGHTGERTFEYLPVDSPQGLQPWQQLTIYDAVVEKWPRKEEESDGGDTHYQTATRTSCGRSCSDQETTKAVPQATHSDSNSDGGHHTQ